MCALSTPGLNSLMLHRRGVRPAGKDIRGLLCFIENTVALAEVSQIQLDGRCIGMLGTKHVFADHQGTFEQQPSPRNPP